MRLKVIKFWVIGVFIAGCATSIDKRSVQATGYTPESTRVEVISIPFDPKKPTYLVAIEPLEMGAEESVNGPPPGTGQSTSRYYGWGPFGWGFPGREYPAPTAYAAPLQGMSERVAKGISAQLLNAMSRCGNIQVIDYAHYLKHTESPSALVRSGEVGPFLIKGTVTEFNEVADAESERNGVSLGWLGTVIGISGAVAGIPGLGIGGGVVAAANPTWEDTRARRTGAVGMDLQILEPASGRILSSIVSHGSFTAESASSGLAVFGIGGGESKFAASALGQATRAAMNDALRQLSQQLFSKADAYVEAK